MSNIFEANTIHSNLQRNWMKDKVHALKAWAMETFLTPVVPTKCVHEWKMKGYNIYRIGRNKYATTKHYCKKCHIIKKTNHKY